MAEDSYIKNLEKVSVTIDGETFDIVAASFRGVPFFVQEYSQDGLGRTIATKKIPFSSKTIHEDLGANTPVHSMGIYLVGDDCDVQKQNLIDACSKEGAAEFVHPWLGKFKARISQLSFSASKNDLGYIKGRIVIEQEEDLPTKSVTPSLKLKTKVDAAELRAKTKASFVEKFNVLKGIKAALNTAIDVTEDILDVISDGRKTLNEVNEFVNDIGKFKANASVIIQSPEDYAARIENLLTTTASMYDIEVDKKDEIREYISIMEYEGGDEVGDLVRNSAASCLVQSLVDAEFSSVDEASQFQEMIEDAFDSLLNDTDDVDAYMTLSGLEATALTYLRDTMADMAVVIEKEVKASTNILTFCFDTYNDVDRIDEIMDRNGFSQGLFITPGKVKVLNK